MELKDIQDLLVKINGATFVSVDAVTYPKPGIRKVTEGLRAIVFQNKKGSGYESMVKRRLAEAGRNPDNFVLSDLKWGSRVSDYPGLIYHAGKDEYYLQLVELDAGISRYYIGDLEASDPVGLGLERSRTNQGLCRTDEVIVRTYKLSNITKIALMGQTRPILRPKYSEVKTAKGD